MEEIQDGNQQLANVNVELLIPNLTPILNINPTHGTITTYRTFQNKDTLEIGLANATDTKAIKHSKKDISDSPVKEEYPQSKPTPPPPAAVLPAEAMPHNPYGSNILLLPIVCFSFVVISVLGVGSARGLYKRWKNPAQSSVRPRSRTGRIDSRRSSASRRSQDCNQSSDSRSSRSSRNSKRRVRMKERDMERRGCPSLR